MTRSEKESKVKQLTEMIDKHSLVGILDLEKIPGSVQLKVKDALKGVAEIKMTRKSILKMSLERSNKKNDEFVEKLSGSCALIFSNENPFKLYKLLKKNKVKASAKSGQISPVDITVPAGPTEVAPGPAISTFQKAGVKTKVDKGKIAVLNDKVVAKTGEVISEDVVALLNLLKIQPVELGMNVDYAFEDGIIYGKDAMDIDEEQIMNDLALCVQKAVNLSVNANYPTKLSIEIMIQKSFNEARSLAVEANLAEKEFICHLLAKASRQMSAIESIVGKN